MANDPPVWPSCVCQNVSCAHEKMSTNDQGGSGCYAAPALCVLPTRGKIFKDIFSGDFSLVVEVPLIHIWCCSCRCRRLTQQTHTHTKDSGKTYDTKSSFHDWFVAVNPNEHAPVFLKQMENWQTRGIVSSLRVVSFKKYNNLAICSEFFEIKCFETLIVYVCSNISQLTRDKKQQAAKNEVYNC